jgi:hypothetical protein
MRRLVQPRSVRSMALAQSASARSDPPAFISNAAICSPVAGTGVFPAILHPPNLIGERNQKRKPLASPIKLALEGVGLGSSSPSS